jgi:hypothetical protein
MTATAQTLYGVVATAVLTGGPSNWQGQGVIDGRVKVMIDTYVALATEAVASTIAFGKMLPVGANVISITLVSTVAQSSVTVTVGDMVSASRYGIAASTELQTAYSPKVCYPKAGVYVTTDNSVKADGTPSATNDCKIIVTTAGGTLVAGTIACYIMYTFD